jgi:hypothetical protein
MSQPSILDIFQVLKFEKQRYFYDTLPVFTITG